MNAIYKREMLAYFTTPSGYVFSAIFFALSGILFSISTFGMQSASTRIYFITMLFSFCVLCTQYHGSLQAYAEPKRRHR